jgi:hypothetical protein
MAISLFFLLFLHYATALELDFTAPGSVKQNEEFTVSINLETQEKYDVKIFVHNSEDEKIERDEYLSEIEDDGWKDSWFYLKETFPDKKEYSLRVLRETGDKTLCVRLRKSGADSFDTLCKNISVSYSEEDEEVQDSNNDEENEQEISEGQIETKSNIEENISVKTVSQPVAKEEKLFLNTKKTIEEPKILVTKQQSIRNGIVYSFLLICIVIIVLMALKKL